MVYINICIDCPVKMIKIKLFYFGSFCRVLMVTDEDSETAVWPINILINIVTALKGTHLHFFISITAAAVVP